MNSLWNLLTYVVGDVLCHCCSDDGHCYENSCYNCPAGTHMPWVLKIWHNTYTQRIDVKLLWPFSFHMLFHAQGYCQFSLFKFWAFDFLKFVLMNSVVRKHETVIMGESNLSQFMTKSFYSLSEQQKCIYPCSLISFFFRSYRFYVQNF